MLHVIALITVLLGTALAACPTVQYSSGTRFSASSFVAGQDIVITSSQVYLFDLANSPIYGDIYIEGTLVFADETDVALNAEYMFVRPGGKLIIGSCDCPFAHKAIITFHGTNKAPSPDGFGTKGLGVGTGGSAYLYGALRTPSWTTISATAPVGATNITLSENVNWQVGDVIVIASTDYSQDQAEKVTITQILSSNRVSFTPALLYSHHSATYWGLEEKAEVGLLTRNIVIQGDTGSDATRFGAHTMFGFGFNEVRLSGVEFLRAGQAGLLARYPVHFHFANDTSNRAFIKDCAVHDCYQRCYTIHHTDGLLIQRNIGYNTRGHCYFLEDGIETNNKFYWNLGLVTKTPDTAERLIPTDTDPVVFWVTNPNNTFVSNVAAGGRSHCWWFALPVNPMGPSATDQYCPRRTPLQYFAHNKAHSCAQDCMHIDRGPDANGQAGGSAVSFNWPDASGNNRWARVGAGYNPVANPTGLNETDVRVEATFHNFHAYRCSGQGTWTRNGLVTFRQPIYADSSIGITFATNGGTGMLQDGIFIGQTGNMGNPTAYERNNNRTGVDGRTIPRPTNRAYPIRGYEFYDGPNTAANIRCYGFQDDAYRQASCISMLRRDEFQISSTNQAYDVLTSDSSVLVNFPDWIHDGDRQSVFVDVDGSVSGRPAVGPQKVVVTNRAQFLKLASCIDLTATRGVMFCPNQYGRVGWDWSAANQPDFWPDPTTVDSLARLSRSDQPASIYMPVCGGACNSPPGSENPLRTISTPRNSFQMTVPLSPTLAQGTRDIMLNFLHSPPKSINVRMTYTDQFYSLSPPVMNEVMLAICVGTTTRLVNATKSARYAYADRNGVADMAPSLAALREAPLVMNWPNRGKGMWYLNTATGYLYVRLVPFVNRTDADRLNAYPAIEAMFTFTGVPSTPVTCPTLTGGTAADRGIPPTGTVSAPPAFGPPAPGVARDDATSLCTATSPPVGTTSGSTTPPTVPPNTANSATTEAASLSEMSTVTTSEASVSMSTTAQSTTSTAFAASTTSEAVTTSTSFTSTTNAVSTTNSRASTTSSASATSSVASSTTSASTSSATTSAASTTSEATTLSAVADTTAASSLTSTTTSHSTTAVTATTSSTAAQTASVSTSLATASTTNSANTATEAAVVAASASADSTTNAATASTVVTSTFSAATSAASTTTTAAATIAETTTSHASLTATSTAAETTTAATGSGPLPQQQFTVTLNWCPQDEALFQQQLGDGFAAYASAFLGRTVSSSEFSIAIDCSGGDSAIADVTYNGGDSAIVGVIVNAINDGSLQVDPNFVASCSGTCGDNVASASVGAPRSNNESDKGIPVWVWIVAAIGAVLVIGALIGVAVFLYIKLGKGGLRSSTRAPLRPMYNLDEMYNNKASA